MARAAFLLLLAVAAPAAWSDSLRIPPDVLRTLWRGSCDERVWRVNDRIQAEDPDAILLAGLMFERGLCVKADIDKAYAYYEQAWKLGRKGAAAHLAGLAGTTAGGADVAAVLWWARLVNPAWLKLKRMDCDPTPGVAAPTQDAVLDALKTWPQDRLEACRGLVAMYALVATRVHYPDGALRNAMDGTVDVRFDLRDGSFDVTASRSSDSEPVALLAEVRAFMADAMARLPRTRESVTGETVIMFRISR